LSVINVTVKLASTQLTYGEIRWDWPLYHKIAKAMKEAAEAHNIPLEWGGDWKNPDGPHFQLSWKEYPK